MLSPPPLYKRLRAAVLNLIRPTWCAGMESVILEEDIDEDYEPTNAEVRFAALWWHPSVVDGVRHPLWSPSPSD